MLCFFGSNVGSNPQIGNSLSKTSFQEDDGSDIESSPKKMKTLADIYGSCEFDLFATDARCF